MTFTRLTLGLLTIALTAPLTTPPAAQAAVSAKTMSAPPKAVSMAATREALSLPLMERVSEIRRQGANGYKNLVSMMFNKSFEMEERWKAVTAAGRVGGSSAKPDLEKALASPEWFMRNAGLVAMDQLDREKALTWSRKLLDDRALIVRAAAVDVIANHRDAASTSLLWNKLNAKENFKGRQSLFIRRRIVEALAQIEGKGREGKFIGLLKDKDATLHEPAIVALERITNQSFGTPAEPAQFKKERWEKWWKANASTVQKASM